MKKKSLIISESLKAIIVSLLFLPFAESALAEEVLKASDGSVTIRLEGEWHQGQVEDDSSAKLRGEAKGDRYVQIWTEAKVDFVKMDLPTFAKQRAELLAKNLATTFSGELTPISIGKEKAFLAEIHGSYDNTRCGVLYLLVEGKQHYCRGMAWTLESQFPQFKAQLKELLNRMQCS